MEIIYNPRDILRVFLEYDPISHIPLVYQAEIKQFIAKNKIQKLYSNVNFLDTPISAVLVELYEEISLELFFQNNVKQNITHIPIIDSEDFTLTACPLKEFQLLFKPINKIEDFSFILAEVNIAIFIVNSKYQLIYQNNECQVLFKEWEDKINHPQFKITNFFLETVANKINTLDNSKIHHLFMEDKKLRIAFKIKEINFKEGNVFLFSILTIVDDR